MTVNRISKLFALVGTVLGLGGCDELGDVIDPPRDPEETMADVVSFETEDVVGTSTLVRNNNGVTMSFHTSDLEPGTVATIWWVVFHNPRACDGDCGADDLSNPDVDGTAFFAAGNVVKETGEADYWASLPVDLLTVDPDEEANQLIAGDGILKDTRDPEIHLVLRTHGDVIPDLVGHQLTTFDAGCTTAPPALQGPNTCANLQFAVHQ